MRLNRNRLAPSQRGASVPAVEQALVFASIIIGVAISDQVLSLHRLLRSGVPVRWHWAQPWFAVLVLMLNIMIWWSIKSSDQTSGYTIAQFVPLLVLLILLALLTVTSLPDHLPPKGMDLAEYYQLNRRYQWGLLATALLWQFGAGLVEATANDMSALDYIEARSTDLMIVFLMIGMAFSRRWWVVALGLAIMSIGPIGWLSRTAV